MRAERTRDEPGAKSGQRRHQAEIGVDRRKEGLADRDREKCKGDEIIEFERIADGDGHDCTSHLYRVKL